MQLQTAAPRDHRDSELPATSAKIQGSLQADQTPLIFLDSDKTPPQVDSVYTQK